MQPRQPHHVRRMPPWRLHRTEPRAAHVPCSCDRRGRQHRRNPGRIHVDRRHLRPEHDDHGESAGVDEPDERELLVHLRAGGHVRMQPGRAQQRRICFLRKPSKLRRSTGRQPDVPRSREGSGWQHRKLGGMDLDDQPRRTANPDHDGAAECDEFDERQLHLLCERADGLRMPSRRRTFLAVRLACGVQRSRRWNA